MTLHCRPPGTSGLCSFCHLALELLLHTESRADGSQLPPGLGCFGGSAIGQTVWSCWIHNGSDDSAGFPQPVERVAGKELIPTASFIRWCNATETVSAISQTKSFILDKNPIKSSVLLHRQIKPRLTGLPRSERENKEEKLGK